MFSLLINYVTNQSPTNVKVYTHTLYFISYTSFCRLHPQIAKARRGGRRGKVTAVTTANIIQGIQFCTVPLRLFSVLYFSVRWSRSRALRYGLPSCMTVHLKIKMAAINGTTRYISTISLKIGDCEQSMYHYSRDTCLGPEGVF